MKIIKIRGMSCQHCVMAVKKALEEIEGVENVTVNLERGEATFDAASTISQEIIKDRIEKAGYELD